MYIFSFPRISMNQYSSKLLFRYSNFSIKSIRIAKSVIHVQHIDRFHLFSFQHLSKELIPHSQLPALIVLETILAQKC